jgi:penicillin G amidase
VSWITRLAGWLAGWLAALAAGAIIAALAAAWMVLRASLPALDGRAALSGLSGEVTVERDAAGVPTVIGRDRNDLARALGYLHGEDRFFQMDLMRRAAAGELSALLGPSTLTLDREFRLHRFRAVAQDIAAHMDAPSRALLGAYVAGVNAGLASLRSRPFEYWLLGSKPQPWRAEDSILCVYAMFLQLQDYSGHLQLQRGLLRATLPTPLWNFLEAQAPEWDAAIDGSVAEAPHIPEAREVDLRSIKGLPIEPPARVSSPADEGSNNWAIAGAHTLNGAAILANDMHLDFRVPIIWYRARLRSPDTDGLDLIGVTLPGTPSIVVGGNRSIAWGFTNSYGEFSKVIRLVPAGDDPGAFATADGVQRLRYVDETIEIKGRAAEHLRVPETPWGPVIGDDWEGHPYALEWSAHDPAAVNLDLVRLEQMRSAADAVRAAPLFGIPGQNFLVADSAGHIGWTIAGRLPLRGAAPLGVPQLSTEPQVGFAGWLAPENQPKIIDPPPGFLWSANARVVGGDAARLIGDDGMDRGARARQIESDLRAGGQPLTPADSLAIQLDDRALFLERWRALMSAVIERARNAGERSQDAAHDVLGRWSGHAAPYDAAFRLVHRFRSEVQARVFYMLIAPARRRAMNFQFEIPPSFEGPLWRALESRPLNLLAPEYADWDQLLHDALTASEQLPAGCVDLGSCGWGKVNGVRVRHPLSAALPMLSRFLDMPPVWPPGGNHDMPRIQGPDYGASERFSLAPGHEDEAYFHMPGGESGHPLSPFYRAGFSAWAEGKPAPLLPGPTLHSLVLFRGG